MPPVISHSDVLAARGVGYLSVPEGALVTPLARESARLYDVELGIRARVQRKNVLAGNWKMHLNVDEATALVQALVASAELKQCGADVILLPPHPYLLLVSALLAGTKFRVGAQNVHQEAEGAYTGEVSVQMLRRLCTVLLVGHSERRGGFGETSDLVWKKARLGLKAGLEVIVCVGESALEREQGRTLNRLREQLAGIAGLDPENLSRLILAYEPVWAIGASRSATPEQVDRTHQSIRQLLRTRLPEHGDLLPLIYGGSVDGKNAAGLLQSVNVDGFLVGRASLAESSFSAVARAFSEVDP